MANLAICLRACYDRPGTDLPYGATRDGTVRRGSDVTRESGTSRYRPTHALRNVWYSHTRTTPYQARERDIRRGEEEVTCPFVSCYASAVYPATPLLCILLRHCYAMLLRICYAMSGTHAGYATTPSLSAARWY
eukprot:2087453-Rhodomonas_salina.1